MSRAARQDRPGYAGFWAAYLADHRRRGTRALHIAGTVGAVAMLAAAVAGGWPWLAVAAVVTGYGCAWLGHALFEHNRPASFRHPLWSLVSDFRLCAVFLSGRLGAALRRAGLGPGEKNG